jgi:glycosyl transferase family 25
MDAQLRREALAYSRIRAVDGGALSAEQEVYHQHELRRRLSRAEIGCLLSHIDAWRRIVEQGLAAAIVMEDDVHMAEGLGDLVRGLSLSSEAADVHRLETFLAAVTASRAEERRVGRRRAVELRSNHCGAGAYALTQAGARMMLAAADRFTTLPDGELFDFRRRAVDGLRVIQWTPAPCVQDRLLGAEAQRGFGSHLEADRLDRRLGLLVEPTKLAVAARKLLHPAYMAAYDAMLRPAGLARLRIPFG